ncbi:MAG: hypothetical protein ACREMY_18110, partial [bacterium]
VQLMEALSAIKVPDGPGPLKRAEDRWKPYLDDPETAGLNPVTKGAHHGDTERTEVVDLLRKSRINAGYASHGVLARKLNVPARGHQSGESSSPGTQ